MRRYIWYRVVCKVTDIDYWGVYSDWTSDYNVAYKSLRDAMNNPDCVEVQIEKQERIYEYVPDTLWERKYKELWEKKT